MLAVADDRARAAGPTEEPDDDAALPDGVGRHRSPATAVRWSPGQPGARSLWLVGLAAALALVLDLAGPAAGRAGPGPAGRSTAASTTTPVGEVAETSTDGRGVGRRAWSSGPAW